MYKAKKKIQQRVKGSRKAYFGMRMDPSLAMKIQELADKRTTTMSVVVAQAITEHLKRNA